MNDDRWTARAERQRDAAILDCALRTFSELGCFQAKLDHVTAEVGIGKGTLYRHYASRGELFAAALRVNIDALVSHCRGIWQAKEANPYAAFCAVIDELVRLNHDAAALSPATLTRLQCSGLWANPDEQNEKVESIAVAFIPLVRTWQTAGLLHPGWDPGWIASVTLAVVGVSSAGPRSPVSVTDAAPLAVRILQQSFTAEPPPMAALTGD